MKRLPLSMISTFSLPLVLLLGACSPMPSNHPTSASSTTPVPPAPPQAHDANGLTDATPDLYTMKKAPDAPQVVRTGRYQLWELGTSAGQQQLINQVVRVSIPSMLTVTVKDALTHLLAGTGYHLCDGMPNALANQPLPLTHRNLGPASLHEALQVLAGPAWVLQQDPRRRAVCFRARLPAPAGPRSGESAVPSSACPYCASEQAHQARMKARLEKNVNAYVKTRSEKQESE